MNDPKALRAAAEEAVAALKPYGLPEGTLVVQCVSRLNGAAFRGELEADEPAFVLAIRAVLGGLPPELPIPADDIPNE